MSEERPFLTAFQRPDRFRYEFRGQTGGGGPFHRYIVWREGTAVRTRWELLGRDERPESLVLALAGATGVSGGSAHTVPSLLLPDEFEGDALRRFVDIELVGQTALGGVACHHLTARAAPIPADVQAQMNEAIRKATGGMGASAPSAERDATHLWITIGTSLLRRMEERVNFDAFATVSVTNYAGETGLTIGDDEFRFDGGGPTVLN